MSTENKELPTLHADTLRVSSSLVAKAPAFDKNAKILTVDGYGELLAAAVPAMTTEVQKQVQDFNTTFFAGATHATHELATKHMTKAGGPDVFVVEFPMIGKDNWEVAYTKSKEVSGGIPKEGQPAPPKKTVYGTTVGKLNVYATGNVGEMSKVKQTISASARALFS